MFAYIASPNLSSCPYHTGFQEAICVKEHTFHKTLTQSRSDNKTYSHTNKHTHTYVQLNSFSRLLWTTNIYTYAETVCRLVSRTPDFRVIREQHTTAHVRNKILVKRQKGFYASRRAHLSRTIMVFANKSCELGFVFGWRPEESRTSSSPLARNPFEPLKIANLFWPPPFRPECCRRISHRRTANDIWVCWAHTCAKCARMLYFRLPLGHVCVILRLKEFKKKR